MPTPSATKRNPYAQLTDAIIAELESGTVAPWHRPWTVRGVPHNASTGRAYRGINVLVTAIASMARGYTSAGWVTFKQANDLAAKAARANGFKTSFKKKGRGGSWVFASGPDAGKSCGGIRKGQNAAVGMGATPIAFWGSFERDAADGESANADGKIGGRFLKTYAVFNVEQCDDAVRQYVAARASANEPREHAPIEAAEAICAGWTDVPVTHGGGRAYYRPDSDTINLPEPTCFESAEHYYATRFHEMGHATGAVHRLNRDGIARFDFAGSHQYADEELVAEFASCFLCAEARIERPTLDNGIAYLRTWAAKLRDDPRVLVFAAQRAQKAADLILDRQPQAMAQRAA